MGAADSNLRPGDYPRDLISRKTTFLKRSMVSVRPPADYPLTYDLPVQGVEEARRREHLLVGNGT